MHKEKHGWFCSLSLTEGERSSLRPDKQGEEIKRYPGRQTWPALSEQEENPLPLSERACVRVCFGVSVHVWHIPAWPSPSSSLPANNLPGGASTLPPSSSSTSLQCFLLLRGERALSVILHRQEGHPSPRQVQLFSAPLPPAIHTQPYGHEPLLSLPPSFLPSLPHPFLCLSCLARDSAAWMRLSQAVPPRLWNTHTHTCTCGF